MITGKKYRILSIEAEKLVHSQMVGGFSARLDRKPNVMLFSGILDYSLEAEKLYEAELYSVNEGDRAAEWNYLMGCVCIKKGHYIDAQRYLERACTMDPGNMEYAQTYNSLRQRGGAYGGGYNTNRQTGGCSGCDICASLACMDCCCECMGGDLISCC